MRVAKPEMNATKVGAFLASVPAVVVLLAGLWPAQALAEQETGGPGGKKATVSAPEETLGLHDAEVGIIVVKCDYRADARDLPDICLEGQKPSRPPAKRPMPQEAGQPKEKRTADDYVPGELEVDKLVPDMDAFPSTVEQAGQGPGNPDVSGSRQEPGSARKSPGVQGPSSESGVEAEMAGAGAGFKLSSEHAAERKEEQGAAAPDLDLVRDLDLVGKIKVKCDFRYRAELPDICLEEQKGCRYFAAYSDCSACGDDEVCQKVKIKGRSDLQCYECAAKAQKSAVGTPAGGQVVAGRVRDKKGTPVEGARVSVAIGGKRYHGRSGPDGRYEIKLPGGVKVPGMMQVSASKDGYEPGSTEVSKTFVRHADVEISRIAGKEDGAVEARDGDVAIANTFRFGETFNFELRNLGKAAWTDVDVEFRFFGNGRVIAQGRYSGGIFLVLNPGAAVPLTVNLDHKLPEHGRLRYEFRWKGRRVEPMPTPKVKSARLEAAAGYGGYLYAYPILTNTTDQSLQAGWCYLGLYNTQDDLIATTNFSCGGVQAGSEEQHSTILNNEILNGLHAQDNPDGSLAIWAEKVSELRAKVYVSPPYVSKADAERAAIRQRDQTRERLQELIRAGEGKTVGDFIFEHLESEERKAAVWQLDQARKRLQELRSEWKTLSDFIDEQRAKGRDVSDLMANLRRIAGQIQVQRGRVADLEKKAGVAKGRIEPGTQAGASQDEQ